jgi:hypothetical protein
MITADDIEKTCLLSVLFDRVQRVRADIEFIGAVCADELRLIEGGEYRLREARSTIKGIEDDIRELTDGMAEKLTKELGAHP